MKFRKLSLLESATRDFRSYIFCLFLDMTDTNDLTTWKQRCARPTCLKPISPLSKYCSDYCGIEVAATRLDLCGFDAEYFWPRVKGARRREAHVVNMSLPPNERVDQPSINSTTNQSIMDDAALKLQQVEDARALEAMQSRLRKSMQHRQALHSQIELIDARALYLKLAVRRWEVLCKATADTLAAEQMGGDEEEEDKPKKPKKRSHQKKPTGTGPTSLPEAPCGLDHLLVLDSDAWRAWLESDEGVDVMRRAKEDPTAEVLRYEDEDLEHVCLKQKKQCARHLEWQKTREQDFAVEKAVIVSCALSPLRCTLNLFGPYSRAALRPSSNGSVGSSDRFKHTDFQSTRAASASNASARSSRSTLRKRCRSVSFNSNINCSSLHLWQTLLSSRNSSRNPRPHDLFDRGSTWKTSQTC